MSKIFDQLVAARGLDAEFLQPKYELCIDPYVLADMEGAVARIKRAVAKREKCIIYGDYDVDGVTASTALFDVLKLAGLNEISVMLPNRFTDGYGMSTKIVQEAVKQGVSLVLTVDCGSRNHEIVQQLREQGIDVLITDHHECGETLPEALAVINPKRRDLDSNDSRIRELREIAGVGVVFKLAQALVRAGLIPEGQEKWLLDLVTIGTICDSMVLRGENRRFCKYGLLVLEKTRRPGLRELMLHAGVKTLSGDAVGFQIGPRLNAAGRMDTAEKALNLLMSKSRAEAALLANELNILNDLRKKQQNAAVREISRQGVGDNPVIIKEGDWHEGVLGIIAGRLVEEYHKPAFVLGKNGSDYKGSGRSFGDFSLAGALDVCRKYIISGGGHAEACGVKVAADQLENFKAAINSYYKSLGLTNQERYLEIYEDMVVEDFDDLSLELAEELHSLEPFGEGNQVPIFRLADARVMDVARLGNEGQHLRLMLWDKFGHNFKVMGFNVAEEYANVETGSMLDAWVTIEENSFRGIRSVEGRIVKLA